MTRILAVLALTTALGSFAKIEHEPAQSKSPFTYKTGVFYASMGADFEKDITEDDLLGAEDVTSLEKEIIPELVAACKKGTGSGHFTDGQARLRLILPNKEEYVVDRYGVVKHLIGKDRSVDSVTQLSQKDLTNLHHLILFQFDESDTRLLK